MPSSPCPEHAGGVTSASVDASDWAIAMVIGWRRTMLNSLVVAILTGCSAVRPPAMMQTLIGCPTPFQSHDEHIERLFSSSPTLAIRGDTYTFSNDGDTIVFVVDR